MESSQQLCPDELADLLPWLEALARQLVRDPGTAADLAQETLLAATASAGSRTGPLRAWLRGVLSNRASRHRRAESRRRERERAAARSESLPADQALERAELAQHLLGRLLAQPEPYRSTLIEHFLEGSPLAEIARRKRLPAATVRSHAMRGLARLRGELEAERGQDEPGLALALAPLADAGSAAGAPVGAASALPVFAKGSFLPRLGAAALLVTLCGVALLALKLQGPSAPPPEASDVALEPLPPLEDPDLLMAGAEAPQAAERASAPSAPAEEIVAAIPYVAGTVRDREGRPVSGASVLWTTDDRYVFPIDSVSAPERGREPFAPQRTATGAQGRFQFPNPGVGPLRLAVSAPGYAPFASTELRILEEAAVTLDPIVLSAGQALICRIVGPGGEGVAGAAIDLEYQRDAGYFASDARAYRSLGESGPDGTFRSSSLPAGPLRLRASHPEHLPAFGETTVPTPPGSPFTLAFPAKTFIEGRVLGVPSHKALSVDYYGNPKSGFGPAPRREHHSGRVPVEADGSFRIVVPAEPKGTSYRLSPVLAPYNMAHPWADPQDVLAGKTGVLFAEPNHAILKLRVVDGDGAGLTNAQLNLARGHLGGSDLVLHRRVHSTAPGDYVIQPVMVIKAEHPQQLIVRVPGYVAAVVGIPVLSKGVTTDLGVVQLTPANGRIVLVKNPQGQPVANAEVVLQVPGALNSREAVEAFGPSDSGSPGRGDWQPSTRKFTTGEDGTATLYPPDQSECLIHASADGFAPRAPVELRQDPGALELVLETGATLEILLQSPDGSPVGGQQVFLLMEDPSSVGVTLGPSFHRDAYSDRSGLVSFAHLPAGTASITVGPTSASAEVPASGTTSTTVTCTPLATPSGIVRLNGKPLSGAELTLMASTDEGSYELGKTTAAGDGKFSFPFSPCGPMHLDVRHPRFPLGLWSEFVLDEQGSPWEVELTADAVSGKLITQDGEAPMGAMLCVVHRSDLDSAARDFARLHKPSFASFSLAQVDASGSFRLRGVPTGADLVLLAVDETHAVSAMPLRLDPGTPREGLRVLLQPASTLLIDVDLTGLPVQQGYVPCNLTLTPTAGPALGSGKHYGKPKADGKARFERLAPGTWILEARVSRLGDDTPSPKTVIELEPGTPLRIEVTALQ